MIFILFFVIFKKRRGENLKNNIYVYVPSYCLAYGDKNRLTDMSLQTMKEGIRVIKKMIKLGKNPIFIVSTSRPMLWEKEAEIKKKMVLEARLNLYDVVIIPAMMDSYDEAEWMGRNILPDSYLTIVAEKYHAPRVAISLRITLPERVKMEVIKVNAKIERQLDTSRFRSWFCNGKKINYILWNLFFGLITPYMMRRQMRKKKGG